MDGAVAPGIFISYRREDDPYAGRLADNLRASFGRDFVFRDEDELRGGVDFVDALGSAVRGSRAVVVVIGPNWESPPPPTIETRETDYVRMELAAAREAEVPVLPVCVGGAKMPGEGDLPADLQWLARIQAFELDDGRRWGADVQALAGHLAELTGRSGGGPAALLARHGAAANAWKERQRAKEAARANAPPFREARAFWVSSAVTLTVCVAAGLLADRLFVDVAEVFGWYPSELDGTTRTLLVASVGWATVYIAIAAAFYADDPSGGDGLFYRRGILGGWVLALSDLEPLAGGLAAFPVPLILGWAAARGVGYGGYEVLDADETGLTVLVFALCSLGAAAWYSVMALDARQ